MSVLKELRPIPPSAFFEVRGRIPKAEKKKQFKKGRLADTTGLTGEGKLVTVALLWSPVGIYVELSSKLEIEAGDTFELFIDTRDLKTSNVITRFCHHFIFDLENETGREATRFRGEDQHELAETELLGIKTDPKGALITLPKEVLHGYDPLEFQRLGLAFRFKKKNGEKQHYNLSSDHFNIEKHPALWASMELVG